MECGLMVNKEELDILDKNNVEYTFWDIIESLNNKEQVEINFDNKIECTKAMKLLNRN